jgi:hypothetical protein
MRMNDVETELAALTAEDGYRLYAQRLQVWRFCSSAACRRAHGCGDPPSCWRRFADWAEAVKASAQRERDANDPAVEALRSELGRRIRRLAEAMRTEA